MTTRTAEYPRPDHFILHISDTHLLAGGNKLYGSVDSETHLRQVFTELEASGGRPEAIVFTGDLADRGEPDAYERIRRIVDPVASRLGARVIWVMGNHDNREAFRAGLFNEVPTTRPVDRVYDVHGLRIIMLTARGRDVEREKGLALGADDYITKPFSTKDAIARVEAVLARARKAERQ